MLRLTTQWWLTSNNPHLMHNRPMHDRRSGLAGDSIPNKGNLLMIKFRLLLWALSLLMKKSAKKNPDFQKQLEGKDFAFQLQTEDGAIVRQFVIKDQTVKSKAKAHQDPAFTISFKDADTGLAILTSKDKNAFMKGIQDKDIKISGDLSLVMWFQGISKHLKPKKKK
jgi:hypothetical protein